MTKPAYVTRVCSSCQRVFVAEDDDPVCDECAEYIEALKNLPPDEGK